MIRHAVNTFNHSGAQPLPVSYLHRTVQIGCNLDEKCSVNVCGPNCKPASFTSQEELDVIASLVPDGSDAWIGVRGAVDDSSQVVSALAQLPSMCTRAMRTQHVRIDCQSVFREAQLGTGRMQTAWP